MTPRGIMLINEMFRVCKKAQVSVARKVEEVRGYGIILGPPDGACMGLFPCLPLGCRQTPFW